MLDPSCPGGEEVCFHSDLTACLSKQMFQGNNQVSESETCSVVSNSLWPHGLYSPWNSPGQNIGVGSLFLLKGIFLTQGSNWGLLHCRWILYQLSYHGSPEATQIFVNIKGDQITEVRCCWTIPLEPTFPVTQSFEAGKEASSKMRAGSTGRLSSLILYASCDSTFMEERVSLNILSWYG